MPELAADAETLDRSDEPHGQRSAWPAVANDTPDEARWRARMETEVDGLQGGQDRIESIVRRMDERQARGGPVVRLATAAGTGGATVLVAALGPGGSNVKYLVCAFIVAVAIAYGATVGLGANGVTVGGTASAHSPSGPALRPVEPQE